MESVAKNKRKLTEEDLKMSKLDKFKRYYFLDDRISTLPSIASFVDFSSLFNKMSKLHKK